MLELENYFKSYTTLFQKVIEKANSESLEIFKVYHETKTTGETEKTSYLVYAPKKFSTEVVSKKRLTNALLENSKNNKKLFKALKNNSCKITIFDGPGSRAEDTPSQKTLKELLEHGHGTLAYDVQFW
ncbi:hypothetical protein HOD29_01140 [archaeon]|jgi:hypothetical protein|nr:hypothetical protein [archaeon]